MTITRTQLMEARRLFSNLMPCIPVNEAESQSFGEMCSVIKTLLSMALNPEYILIKKEVTDEVLKAIDGYYYYQGGYSDKTRLKATIHFYNKIIEAAEPVITE